MATIDPELLANPLEDHLGYLLRRASNQVMASLADDLASLELTVVQASLLVLIERNPGVTQSDIGRALGINRANVAPLVASLTQRDLIVRQSSRGRLIGMVVSEAGRVAAHQARRLMLANDKRHSTPLSPEAIKRLKAYLAAIWHEA